MPSFEVRMRKDEPPRFPPICIGCGGEPTTKFEVREDSIGWWSAMRFGWLYGVLTGHGIAVPACDPCARRLRRQRLTRKAIQWVLIAIGLVVGFWLFDDLEGWKHKVAVIGLGLLLLLPWLIWEVTFPQAIEIVVTESVVTYQFADETYAQRFADDNRIL